MEIKTGRFDGKELFTHLNSKPPLNHAGQWELIILQWFIKITMPLVL